MKRHLLLLCLLAAGCSTTAPTRYSQAVGPLVEPMVEPVPSFPHPGYTPNGAGLPGERLPGQPGPDVPRSPNKRILPADPHPGLWAADGAPVASGSTLPAIFGVEFNYPKSATTPDAQHWSDRCGMSLDSIARRIGTHDEFLKLILPARQCLAAEAYKACADGLWRMLKIDALNGPLSKADEQAIRDMRVHGDELVRFNCKSPDLVSPFRPSLRRLLGEWEKERRAGVVSMPKP